MTTTRCSQAKQHTYHSNAIEVSTRKGRQTNKKSRDAMHTLANMDVPARRMASLCATLDCCTAKVLWQDLGRLRRLKSVEVSSIYVQVVRRMWPTTTLWKG